MASTYRDSAGVERPTQWERACSQMEMDGTIRAIAVGRCGSTVEMTVPLRRIGDRLGQHSVTPDGFIRIKPNGIRATPRARATT